MKEEIKKAMGVAYLTTIIIAAFSLATRVANAFLQVNKFEIFLNRYILWVVVVAAIILILYRLNKNHNQRLSNILKDSVIRKTSGILVIINGALVLSDMLPIYINYILSIKQSEQIGISKNILINSLIINTISVIFTVLQILLGIYLSKCGNRKHSL